MNRETISNVIGKIDPAYIAEAGEYRVSREETRDGRILNYIAAACAVVVLIVALPLISKFVFRGKTPGNVPGETGDGLGSEVTVRPEDTDAPSDVLSDTVDLYSCITQDDLNRVSNGMMYEDVKSTLGCAPCAVSRGETLILRYMLDGRNAFAEIAMEKNSVSYYIVTGIGQVLCSGGTEPAYDLSGFADAGEKLALTLAARYDSDIFDIDASLISFTFENGLDEEVRVDPLYMLEKRINSDSTDNDEWLAVDYDESAVQSGQTAVAPGETAKLTLTVRSLYGYLSPGRYRLTAVADGEDASYAVTIEFSISNNARALLAEATDYDPECRITSAAADTIKSGTKLQQNIASYGLPAQILSLDPLTVRYIVAGDKEGVDIEYSYPAKDQVSYIAVRVTRREAEEIDRLTSDSVYDFYNFYVKRLGVTVDDINKYIGESNRDIGNTALYKTDGGTLSLVYGSITNGANSSVVSELRYSSIRQAEEEKIASSVKKNMPFDAVIKNFGLPDKVKLSSRLYEQYVTEIYYFFESGNAAIVSVKNDANGTPRVYDIRIRAQDAIFDYPKIDEETVEQVIPRIMPGMTEAEVNAYLGSPRMILARTDAPLTREARHFCSDGSMFVVLYRNSDGKERTVAGVSLVGDSGASCLDLSCVISMCGSGSVVSHEEINQVTGGTTLEEIVEKFGVPTKFEGRIDDKYTFSYALADRSISIHITFRMRFYIEDGAMRAVLEVVDKYYL